MDSKSYDQMILALETGECVIVRDYNDNQYCVLSPYKDDEGNYRISGWYSTWEIALTEIAAETGYEAERLKGLCANWKLISIPQPTYPPIPVGTKVKVREDAKEICEKLEIGINVFIKEFKGRVFAIERTTNQGLYQFRLQDDRSSEMFAYFPRQALTVVTGEEEGVVELTLEDIAKLKGVPVEKIRIKD